MVDVKSKLCEYSACEIRPTFGIKGGKAQFCAKHKLDKMVDVKSKLCEYNGCNSANPVFDIQGGKGKFCGIHKIDEMINVNSRRCHKIHCESLNTSFDNIGGIGRFCVKHKTSTMIDIKSRLCNYYTCKIYAFYGKPGEPKSHCAKHREPGMIRRPNGKCKSCKEPAIWGTNWIPIHCEMHKTEDESNLVEQLCSSCGLLYVLDKENRCENCNPKSFATARLAKQNALMDYLDSRGLKGNTTDTIIDGGICGKERPDRVYDFEDKIVILECDEHQHRDRACECEQTRMINIGQSFGGMPVYFIRWNPDDYSPANNRKHPELLKKRHKLCGDFISDIKESKLKIPHALLSVIYLYYDGWDSLANEEWKVVMGMM